MSYRGSSRAKEARLRREHEARAMKTPVAELATDELWSVINLLQTLNARAASAVVHTSQGQDRVEAISARIREVVAEQSRRREVQA
jgi:hypothetical protein